MEKVILITGASSGIGKETVKLFQTKNWKVAATMRDPEKETELQNIIDVECIRLDVTDIESIRSAIKETLEKFGRIDAIVNNAGYGLVGAFEAATVEQIEDQFQTNVFGLMNVCREILPYFREQKRGTIVNVSSMGGRITFPLYSLYHATKWGVEGFSESLQYEVRPFNIKIKIIEPGPIKTDFYDRSQDLTKKEGLTAYDSFIVKALPNMQKAGENAPDGSLVAEVIYNAVTDGSWKLRYSANSRMILTLRKILPDALFMGRKAIGITMKKRIFNGLAGAVVGGVILNLIVPSILLVASNLSTSVGTIIDPLRSDDHLEDVWFSVAIIISLMTMFAFAGSIITGLVVSIVSLKIRSGWGYFISAAASLVIHYLLLAMLVYAILATAAEDAPPGLAFYSFFAVTLSAFAVGLIGYYFSRQIDRQP